MMMINQSIEPFLLLSLMKFSKVVNGLIKLCQKEALLCSLSKRSAKRHCNVSALILMKVLWEREWEERGPSYDGMLKNIKSKSG